MAKAKKDPLAPQDLDAVLENAREREGRIKSYREAAQEHLDLKDSELLANAEMLRKTGFLDFIKAKCAKVSEDFIINDNCNLRNGGFYLVPMNKEKDKPGYYKDIQKNLTGIETALNDLGIPKDDIVRFTWFAEGKADFKDNPKVPAEGIYVNLTADIVEKIIEKETEVRLAIVKKPFEDALEKLKETSKALEEQTGQEVFDDHPERSMGFTERFIENTRDDIRRKVKEDIFTVPQKTKETPAR